MENPSIPMGSSLLAVALVIRSRDGPRFVFHYPARPSEGEQSDQRVLWGTDLQYGEEDRIGDDFDDIDLDPGEVSISKGIGNLNVNSKEKEKRSNQVEDEEDYHYDTSEGEHIVPWESLFEIPTVDLESILTPSKAYHKKKFELALDPLTFITYPIHIRMDGTWSKKQSRREEKAKAKKQQQEDLSASTTTVKTAIDESKIAPKENDSDDGDETGGMTMFNLVFIMEVRDKKQAPREIKDVYDYVVKQVNKALKAAQASSNYVWKESELMLSMKEKAREDRTPMSKLWKEILVDSTLACAIRDLYRAVSNNKIATLHFPPTIDLSVQVPVPSIISSLPSFDEKGMPGLLVTSANPLINEAGEEDAGFLNKHFALLLMDNEHKVISQIQADMPDPDSAAPLIECIKLCKATLSFAQVAQTHNVDVNSLLVIAQHLIFWRRAIAYPPLHSRNEYIVSPNCDSRKLPAASIAWKKAFPLAPPLPSFLAGLVAPRMYKTFAPSKDHRPTYLEMLAWLIRGGWVTQLRTFAWILVWPEIVYEVKYKLKEEELEEAKNPTKSHSGFSEPSESADDSNTSTSGSIDPDVPLTTEQLAENARLQRVAEKKAKLALEDAVAFAKMPKPVVTDCVSINQADHLDEVEPYIIKDPHKVSNEESLYIKAIGERVTDPKIKEWWPKLVKYFNGKQALEEIALIENMKRKEMMTIIDHFGEHQLRTKHW